MWGNNGVDISDMKGKTLLEVDAEKGDGVAEFKTSDGFLYKMFHDQECCEQVELEDVCGDVNDLIGNPLLIAESVSSEEGLAPKWSDSYTWTFYKLATIKGSVTFRWLGQSNGYYSEEVGIQKTIAE